jgi:membrane fusion protein, multidrug efflux system
MSIRRGLQGAGVLLVIAAAIGWLSGAFESKIPPEERPAPVGQAAPTSIDDETAIVVERVLEPAFEWASGTVRSARRTTVAARILARIEAVRVNAGDDVAAGDLLLTLDARDLRARVAQVRESLKAAQAQRDLAQRELDRADELLKRGIGTRQRYDQALSALQVGEAEVNGLRQSLDEAQTALSYTQIKAPVAGRVIDRLAEPGDTVAPGQPLLRLYDPAALRIEAPVRESLAVRLNVGDDLRIEVPALAETMTGPIDEIVPFAESGARTLLVKVRMPSDARLFAGLYARIAIPAGERARIPVPAEAVTRIGQLEFVTVIEDTGPAKRMVTSGERLEDGRLDILSGLSAGERIALGGNR